MSPGHEISYTVLVYWCYKLNELNFLFILKVANIDVLH
jgi:hypothetical protein